RRTPIPTAIQAEIKFYESWAGRLERAAKAVKAIAAQFGVRIEGTIVETAIRAAESLVAEFRRRAAEKRRWLSKRRKGEDVGE
ncbi:MAG: hypothetical protein RMK94_17435, partial [Armatimonadota bacterium]|nr:hypothetical protein [Armatimonadota bacterium]